MKSATNLSPRMRLTCGSSLLAAVLLLIVAAGYIPFGFESSTLFYKFGFQKFLLRGGKVVGLTAAVLLFLQIVPVARFRFLDRIFALNRMYNFHRYTGLAIAALVLLHALMILASENFTIFKLELRYWPEWLGVGLACLVLGVVTTGYFRTALNWGYESWLRIHRPLTPLLILGVTTHILFVSETFESGLPRLLVLVVVGLNLLALSRIWLRRLFPRHRTWRITRVTPTGTDALAIDLKNDNNQKNVAAAGQFAFIRPLSALTPKEEHPFTIASGPLDPGHLQFVIRMSGDWTGRLDRLQPGEAVTVDGPFGLFSHDAYSKRVPLILVAGGIGVTPMLSMLRYMAATGDSRKTLLVWSNKTAAAEVLKEEFARIEAQLPQLDLVRVRSRAESDQAPDDPVIIGRLDQNRLDQLLEGYSRQSEVFLCGPPPMMAAVNRMLRQAGFGRTRIHMEKFQF